MWHSKSKRATSWIVGIYIMAQVGLALEEATNTQFSTVWHMGWIHYVRHWLQSGQYARKLVLSSYQALSGIGVVSMSKRKVC